MDAHKSKKYIMVKKIHLRKPEKSTNLIERLKLKSELKFTMPSGNGINERRTDRQIYNALSIKQIQN